MLIVRSLLPIFTFISGVFLSQTLFAFSDEVEHRFDEVVSVFENSTTEIQYDYISNRHDGRGYTAGRAGFTTETGDLLLVVQNYFGKGGHNSQLQKIYPIIEARAKNNSGSVEGLEKLPALWRKLSSQKNFRESQDEVCEFLYKIPAFKIFEKLHLSSALSYLIIYDSIIQHGQGDPNDDDDYQDSLQGIISRLPTWKTEEEFLTAFLDEREKDLLHPYNPDTAQEWSESVDRVRALRRLLLAKNYDLAEPFTLHVWKENFKIK